MLAAMARLPVVERIGRVLVGIGLMCAVVAVAGALIWSQAPRWGIPYAQYQNEFGSECRTTWTGYVCEPMTLAEIESVSELELPAGTQVQEAVYTSTHNYAMDATLVLPDETSSLDEALAGRFGDCRDDVVVPVPADWDEACVRSSVGLREDNGAPPAITWQVTQGAPEDTGDPTLRIEISSR